MSSLGVTADRNRGLSGQGDRSVNRNEEYERQIPRMTEIKLKPYLTALSMLVGEAWGAGTGKGTGNLARTFFSGQIGVEAV